MLKIYKRKIVKTSVGNQTLTLIGGDDSFFAKVKQVILDDACYGDGRQEYAVDFVMVIGIIINC